MTTERPASPDVAPDVALNAIQDAPPLAGATRRIPRPLQLPETAAYRQAASEGRLLVKRCTACGEHHHYPRDICPHCLSADTEWLTASGAGTLYSFSTMGHSETAYTLAFIALDEGVTMMSNLVDCTPAGLAIGQRVRLSIESARTGYLYVINRELYADGSTGEPYLIFPTTRLHRGDNKVTIGRIEVTAVSTAPDTKQRPGSRRPAMSLEEYLTRRQGGRP